MPISPPFGFLLRPFGHHLHLPARRPARPAPVHAPPNAAGIPDLEERIEILLKTPFSRLVMPTDIKQLYQYKSRAKNRKLTAGWCTYIATLNAAAALFDLALVPRPVLPIVILFRLLISASFIGGASLLKTGRLPARAHLLVILPCLLTIFCAGATGFLAHNNALLERYLTDSVVTAATAMTFVQIELKHLRRLAAMAIAIMAGFIIYSSILPFEKLQIICFYGVMMAALAHGRHIRDLYAYRLFLWSLLDEIKNIKASKRNEMLSNIAYIDKLTAIPNRRFFDESCQTMINTVKAPLPLSLCMIDIDHFKQLNDRMGHLQGDYCLQVIAAAIRNNLIGKNDILARFGGEEFVILLPETNAAGAMAVAERIRTAIIALDQPNPGARQKIVTVSIGVAVATLIPAKIETLIATADSALYRAKHSGRNRVCI